MKNKIVIFCFLLSLFLCVSYTSNYKKVEGAHPGSTGAPGDLTCAQYGCHADAQVISNAVNNNTLVFSNIDSTYNINTAYTITVQVQGTAINPVTRFGFELVALRNYDSTNIGQFTITQPNRTQIIDHLYQGDTRYSVTHKAAGTPALSSNFNQWIVTWTAPSFNAGPITFYYATNITNDNGLNTGDRIYLHSFKIKPAADIGLKEHSDEYLLNTFYSAAEKSIHLNYKLGSNATVKISFIDNLGREVMNLPSVSKTNGQQNDKIELAPNIKGGVYFVRLQVNSRTVSKKIIVE